jgi:hypothetical protein
MKRDKIPESRAERVAQRLLPPTRNERCRKIQANTAKNAQEPPSMPAGRRVQENQFGGCQQISRMPSISIRECNGLYNHAVVFAWGIACATRKATSQAKGTVHDIVKKWLPHRSCCSSTGHCGELGFWRKNLATSV